MPPCADLLTASTLSPISFDANILCTALAALITATLTPCLIVIGLAVIFFRITSTRFEPGFMKV